MEATRRCLLRRARQLERVAHDALDPATRKHGRLHRNLLREALVLEAADVGVLALRILTDDDHVDVAALHPPQRRRDAGQQDAGSLADVLVEAAPHRQQQAVQRDVVLDVRVSDCAEEDGVEPAQHVQPVRVHHPAVLEVVVGAPRELGVRELDAEPALRGVQHLDAFLDDLRPNAVSAYDRYLVLSHARACLRSRVGWQGFSHAPAVHATIG